jgi:hypothetical protein
VRGASRDREGEVAMKSAAIRACGFRGSPGELRVERHGAAGSSQFHLKPGEHLSQNEIDAATLVRVGELNTQEQKKIVWPASSVVGRACVDQLTRSKALAPERGAAAILDRLTALAAQIDRDAAGAAGRDAVRLRSLAATLRGRVAKFR